MVETIHDTINFIKNAQKELTRKATCHDLKETQAKMMIKKKKSGIEESLTIKKAKCYG